MPMAVRPPRLGRARELWFAAGVFCLFFGSPVAHAGGIASFAGSYNGTGRSQGMAMVLNEDGSEVYGRIADGDSNPYQINGLIDGTTVRGRLYSPTTNATFTLEISGSRLEFVLFQHPQAASPISTPANAMISRAVR